MSTRAEKFSSLIKNKAAEAIENLIDYPGTIITVTAVDVSADLKNATVWLSIYGKNIIEAKESIDRSTSEISKHVSKDLKSKFTPKLSFQLDTSLEYADKINRLIKKIK